MTREEIANFFIRAAIIDKRLPIQARPAKLKAFWIPFTHSEEDLTSRIRTRDKAEKLQPWDDPFNEWEKEFWDEDKQRIRPEAVADWERANDLIKFVSDEGNRRALWHWAIAKAGGKPFTRWCKAEGIHEMTGSRRVKRAIAVIEQRLNGRAMTQNEQDGSWGLLPVGPVFEHISDNIAAAAPMMKPGTWRDDTAFQPIGDEEFRDFSWAAARNERRRQREDEKRKGRAA